MSDHTISAFDQERLKIGRSIAKVDLLAQNVHFIVTAPTIPGGRFAPVDTDPPQVPSPDRF